MINVPAHFKVTLFIESVIRFLWQLNFNRIATVVMPRNALDRSVVISWLLKLLHLCDFNFIALPKQPVEAAPDHDGDPGGQHHVPQRDQRLHHSDHGEALILIAHVAPAEVFAELLTAAQKIVLDDVHLCRQLVAVFIFAELTCD